MLIIISVKPKRIVPNISGRFFYRISTTVFSISANDFWLCLSVLELLFVGLACLCSGSECSESVSLLISVSFLWLSVEVSLLVCGLLPWAHHLHPSIGAIACLDGLGDCLLDLPSDIAYVLVLFSVLGCWCLLVSGGFI